MGCSHTIEGGAYAHYFSECPCCGKQLSVVCRIQGNIAEVKAEHWGKAEPVLPSLKCVVP